MTAAPLRHHPLTPSRPPRRPAVSSSPAAPPASASPWSAERTAAAPGSASSPARADRVERSRRELAGTRRRRRRRRRQDRHPPHRPAARRPARRAGRPDQQRLQPRARCRSRRWPTPSARSWSWRSPRTCVGPFRLTRALLGALAASAREGRGAGRAQRLQRRGGQRLPRLGRLRREQGRAPPPERHLGRRSSRELGIRVLSLDPGDMDTPLHALAVPDADPATLKRPEAAAERAARRHRGCARRGSWRHDRRGESRPPPARDAAKLLVVDGDGRDRAPPRATTRRPARGPATWWSPTTPPPCPASLHGDARADRQRRSRCGSPAGARSRRTTSHRFAAVVFGAGDLRTPHRAPPAAAAARAGRPARARAARGDGRAAARPSAPRRRCDFDGDADAVWAGIARTAGRSSTPTCPSRWRCGTCGRRSPPAGRVRAALGRLRARLGHARRGCARGASASPPLTHAAGISSTGDAELDRRLPFDEPYRIPVRHRARRSGGRGRAAGASSRSARRWCARSSTRRGRRPGAGRRGAGDAAHRRRRRALRVVDAILSGTHEPGTSHYELLRAFADDATLARADARAGGPRLSDARVRRFGPPAPTSGRAAMPDYGGNPDRQHPTDQTPCRSSYITGSPRWSSLRVERDLLVLVSSWAT